MGLTCSCGVHLGQGSVGCTVVRLYVVLGQLGCVDFSLHMWVDRVGECHFNSSWGDEMMSVLLDGKVQC